MQLNLKLDTVALETIWTHDDFPSMDIFNPGNGLDGEDPDCWQCWRSEVQAIHIHDGKVFRASAYMGGTWERYGDNPEQSNPDISGYRDQMEAEAIEELQKQLNAYTIGKGKA